MTRDSGCSWGTPGTAEKTGCVCVCGVGLGEAGEADGLFSKGVRTYPPQQRLHLFKPILEGLDIALWRTALLCDLDIGAVELVRAAV